MTSRAFNFSTDVLLHIAGALAIQIGCGLAGYLLDGDVRIAVSIGGVVGAGAFVLREVIQRQSKDSRSIRWAEAWPVVPPCALVAVVAWVWL